MKKAFTLIELLVVIAIIAILAAILFPVFATAREKARQSSCSSNEKQLGIALIQYCQDFDEHYPCGLSMNYPTWTNGEGWGAQIYPYVKSTGVFQCPDNTAVATPPNVPVNYALNNDLTRTGNTGVGSAMTQLTAPAMTVLLIECQGAEGAVTIPGEGVADPNAPADANNDHNGYSKVANGIDLAIWWNPGLGATYETGYMGRRGTFSGNNANDPVVGWHSGGSNVLLCDGHVKWLKGTQISSGWGQTSSATQPQNSSWAAGTLCTSNCDGANGPAFAVTFSPL